MVALLAFAQHALVVQPDLVEREALIAELNDAHRAGGRLVLIGAEAGGGKTSLVREFVRRVDGRVLSGACEPLSTPVPLGPLLDVSAQLGGEMAADARAGRPARHIGLALIESLREPVVLVIEDAHWADEATLDVIRVIARRVDATPSLVLVTYRDQEAAGAHPLRQLLGDLVSVPAVQRLAVPPLSSTAVGELAARYGRDGDALYALTRGNPFFVSELLGAGVAVVPETVRDAVLTRSAQLSGPAQLLLESLALLPTDAELWLIERAFPELAGEVDECISAGVLENAGDAVAFRHELARLAVESTVPPMRRRQLHRRILNALQTASDVSVESARLSHHAEQAGDAAAALVYARAAAERAAMTGSHREAAAHYSAALRHGSTAIDDGRADLLVACAVELQASGAYAEAIDMLREAVELRRSLGDLGRAGEHMARLTMPYILLGLNAEADAASRNAVELLGALPDSSELAMAYGQRSYVQMIQRDNADAIRSGERAIVLARRFDAPDILALGLCMTGTALMMSGEIDRGVALLEESLHVASEHRLELRVAGALWMLGSGLGEMYELGRARRYLQEHIAFADDHELDSAYTRAWLAAVLIYEGRWTEGADLATQLLAHPAAETTRITALIALGRARARRGDPGAADVLDEALQLAAPGGHVQRLAHVYAARAEAAWLAGDPERTIFEAQSAYDLALEKRHLWFGGELAYWQWKADALLDPPDWVAEPYRLQIAGNAGAAAERWRQHLCPYEEARAMADAEDPVLVRAALPKLEQLGAAPAAKATRRRLRSLGVQVPRGPRPATRTNAAELTGREIEVLQLLAGGHRNAEIATELVVSPRTVDHHVSAIMRKLGARTRGEAVATARNLGALPDD
jgi:DNA-binding CsgD family transcriptional regulator/tetratricopeptide (TPR) repeat protein